MAAARKNESSKKKVQRRKERDTGRQTRKREQKRHVLLVPGMVITPAVSVPVMIRLRLSVSVW